MHLKSIENKEHGISITYLCETYLCERLDMLFFRLMWASFPTNIIKSKNFKSELDAFIEICGARVLVENKRGDKFKELKDAFMIHPREIDMPSKGELEAKTPTDASSMNWSLSSQMIIFFIFLFLLHKVGWVLFLCCHFFFSFPFLF